MNGCYSYKSCSGTQAYLFFCLRSIDSCDSLHITTVLFSSHLSMQRVICLLTLLLWVSPSGQLSTTQPLARFPPPPVGWGKRKGSVKARKPVGRDKNCLVSRGQVEEERKQDKPSDHSSPPTGRPMTSQFPSKR